jgi:hypothetical protein
VFSSPLPPICLMCLMCLVGGEAALLVYLPEENSCIVSVALISQSIRPDCWNRVPSFRHGELSQIAFVTFKEPQAVDTALLLSVSAQLFSHSCSW